MHWIYTLPGSLVITALLAWPASRQGAPTFLERVGFCVLSMLGVSLFIWGFHQPAGGMNDNLDSLDLGGPVVGLVATAFLVWIWFDKVVGIISDLLLGCFEFSDQSRPDGNGEARQIQKAIRLYRTGRHYRALRLCNQIIDSNSQHTSAAAALAYWIERRNGIRFVENPRSNLTFRGKYSHLNWLFAF